MLQAHYGERLSMSTVENCKRKYWQAQRELIQEMSQTIGSSGHRVITESCEI